jgi:hypothetical protein
VLLNVITALIRSKNLKKILESLIVSRGDTSIDIHWMLVVDQRSLMSSIDVANTHIQEILAEVAQKTWLTCEAFYLKSHKSPANIGFENAKDGMICLVDDDNIMHPDYISAIHKEAEAMTIEDFGFLYNQILGKPPSSCNQRVRKVVPYRIGPGRVDTAQVTITKKLLKNRRWPNRELDMSVTCPDGVFIGGVYSNAPNKFKIINRSLCYYNYLSGPGLDFS